MSNKCNKCFYGKLKSDVKNPEHKRLYCWNSYAKYFQEEISVGELKSAAEHCKYYEKDY